ncbi:MAG: hypothetical protein WA966_02245, partial [Ornithinimicrobium sp.]
APYRTPAIRAVRSFLGRVLPDQAALDPESSAVALSTGRSAASRRLWHSSPMANVTWLPPTPGDGVFTRAEALAQGHSDDQLQAWVRQGRVRRLRPGIFASGPAPDRADARLLERAQGLARRHPDRVAISHHAALLMHGVAVFGVPMGILHAVRLSGAPRSSPGLLLARPRTPPPTVTVHGAFVVRPEVAVVQVACLYGLNAGLVSADSAVHRGLVDTRSLADEVGRIGCIPGVEKARRVVQLCRAGAESPGETLVRLAAEQAGLATQTQFPINDRGQPPFAFADLRVRGTRTLVEFDGAVKYAGAQGREALVKEKLREDRIRRLGWTIERVVWRDLGDPQALQVRLLDAAQRGGSALDVSKEPNSDRNRSAS